MPGKSQLFKKKLDPINTSLANAKIDEHSKDKNCPMFLSPSPASNSNSKDRFLAFRLLSSGHDDDGLSISPPSTSKSSSKDELSISPLTSDGDSQDSFTP